MICDFCLVDNRSVTQLSISITEYNEITHEPSNVCSTCLNCIRVELIGVRDLRRVSTSFNFNRDLHKSFIDAKKSKKSKNRQNKK